MLHDVTPSSPPTRPEGIEGWPSPRFAELRDLGRRAADAGHLDEALRLFEEAHALAVEDGDTETIDYAYCNRAAVLVVVGREAEVMTGLRAILMRGSLGRNGFLAAYNLSRAHEVQKNYKKGLFYARMARDRAIALGAERWLAWSRNLIGNCLLAESYFDEAAEEYETALDLLPSDVGSDRAALLSNLGYCEMMLGRVDEGMSLAFQALRRSRRAGAGAYLPWPHLDLAYGYLELDRIDRARRHAQRGLAAAEEIGDAAAIKSSLFLMGEVERAAGEAEAAHASFSQLQRRFYPGQPQIADLMVAVSMRQVVNLRA